MASRSARVFEQLKKHGPLLLNDAHRPNVCALVVGERVRGSWWAHPRAQEIFDVYDELGDHPDILITKLVSGEVTYVHKSLWPHVVMVGQARKPWQMAGCRRRRARSSPPAAARRLRPGAKRRQERRSA